MHDFIDDGCGKPFQQRKWKTFLILLQPLLTPPKWEEDSLAI